MSTRDVYVILMMERLGYPKSTRLRPILEHLMTSEQAQIAVQLPGSIDEVAQKTGVSRDRVQEQLDDLFFKGVVFPRGSFDQRDYFRFARAIVQLHDATQATQVLDSERDRRFFELWQDFCVNEWYPRLGQAAAQAERPRSRIVPAYRAIKDLPGVLPCEDFRELLKAQELIAVAPCSCRLRTTAVGKPCQYTREVETWHCLQFGRSAEYVIKRGSGKAQRLDEALNLLDAVEEDGLLHIWPNNAELTGVNVSCQCCRDCCQTYVPIDMSNGFIGTVWEKSRYLAYVQLEDCNGCQDCVDRCKFDAIDMERPAGSKKYKAVIAAEKCFGCGVCVLACAAEALKLRVARPPAHIPGAVVTV